MKSYQVSARGHERERESKSSCAKGVPIGNLTSQIFANIYLNELDRFVKHMIRPQAYLRYGDDFIVIAQSREKLAEYRKDIIAFLAARLILEINSKNDIMVKVRHGLHFLGCDIFPNGRRLKKRNRRRMARRLNTRNISSYHGLVRAHENAKYTKRFRWEVLERLHREI